MVLPSESFAVDPAEETVRRHNEEAVTVMSAYRADQPTRVPVICGDSFVMHGFYAQETGLDYREYYNDPDVMLAAQLGAARRRRELPLYDMRLGELPEAWKVVVDQWPVVFPGWIGCEILYRQDSVVAHRGLNLGKKECDALNMPDPVRGGILDKIYRYWSYLKDKYEGGFRFMGRPVRISAPVGASGLFCSALDIRGPEIMLDMYEDPEFVDRFLWKVAIWIKTLCETWDRLTGSEIRPFDIWDHGTDMLSREQFERFILPVVLKMNRNTLDLPRMLHHCGKGAHLFPVYKRNFNLQSLHGITYPLLDVARIRAQVGPDTWVHVFIEDSIINLGTPEAVRQTVRDLMASGAKGRGRLSIVIGDMLKGTSLKNMEALYEAVREYGGY